MDRTEEIKRRSFAAYRSSGIVKLITPAELAQEIERSMIELVQVSLVRALNVARKLTSYASRSPHPVKLASYRALARAALLSSKYDESRKAYLKARYLAKGDRKSIGRIDRTLVDVYMYLGDFAESKRRAQMALRTFNSFRDRGEVAKAQVNYANLLHRQDRHREAEKLYKRAGEYFEGAGDELSAARCWFNRANTLVQLFAFEEAESVYRKSEAVYRKFGQELDAVDAVWGRSWIHMLEGKFHIALRELAECEQEYRRIGRPLRVASCVLDRAEVFLNLNLFDDARACSLGAERQFRKLGVRYEIAKAAYYRSVAAAALGRTREAQSALKRAAPAFSREKNIGFRGAVCILKAQLSGNPLKQRQHLRRATELFRRAQLPLWSAVADIHASFDSALAGSALARLSKNSAAQGVPHLYAAWQTRLGDKLGSAGKMAEASRHWEQAADRLDQIRAQLPPLGLRSKYGSRVQSPHTRLVMANLASDPTMAAVWSERYKTAGIWRPASLGLGFAPSRRKVEQSLAALAGRFAALSSQVQNDGERSLIMRKSPEQINRMQRAVRQELLSLEESATDSFADNRQLARQFVNLSHEIPIVQLHSSASDLVAFVHEKGRTRAVRYPRGTTQTQSTMAQWNFLLETAALSPHLPSGGDIAAEERWFAHIGEWLWKPLDLETTGGRVLLLVEGPLTNLPWQAIRVAGESLSHRYEFLQSPSLRHFLHARRPAGGRGRSAIFVGQTTDLPAVNMETDVIHSALGPETSVFNPCRRLDWPDTGEYKYWHFAGHAQLNEQNPFYSALQLVDGPLFAADFRLKQVDVQVVTLAACQTGVQVAAPGEESTGLVRSFLEMGARSVVAGTWPVADAPTALWMGLFYNWLNDDMKPIAAARKASLVVREKYPAAYHWAAFSVYGAGV